MSEMEASDIPAEAPVAPEAVPVVAQQPSSSVEAEIVEAPVSAPVPLEDAVRALVIFLRDGRRAGDADVDSAIADVEAALAA